MCPSLLPYFPHSLKFLSRTVVELLKDDNIDTIQATEALGLALTHGCATRDIFNAYLAVHARAGDVGAVKRGMDVMTARGLAYNAETHAAFLDAHSWAGDTQGLMLAFGALCNAQETLDADLCALVIVHFARTELMEAGRPGYHKENGGNAQEQITRIMKLMRLRNIVPTQRAYNALLELYMRTRNTRQLMQVWHEMKAQGVSRNIHSYNMALEGLRVSEESEVDKDKTDEIDQMRKFIDLAKEMHEDKTVKPDTHTFNTLFLANKSFPDEATSPLTPLLSSIISSSLIKPDIFTYNSLIHQYVREQNFGKISGMIAQMTHEGISLDRVTYMSLMKISASQGPEVCLFPSFLLSRTLPFIHFFRVFSFPLVFSCFHRVPYPSHHLYIYTFLFQAVLKVYREMEKTIKPNTRTYQVLISELCRAGAEVLFSFSLFFSLFFSSLLPAHAFLAPLALLLTYLLGHCIEILLPDERRGHGTHGSVLHRIDGCLHSKGRDAEVQGVA